MLSDPRVQAYLKGATGGLPAGQKRLVRAELEGHLQHRIAELSLGGLSAQQALQQALEELGQPTLVRAGMQRLYVFPKVWPWLAMLALALGWWVQSHSSGSVLIQLWELGNNQLVQPMLVGLDDLSRELGRQGVEVEPVQMLGFVQAIEMRFPQGILLARTVQQNGHTFVTLDELVLNALEFGIPLRLEGWEQLRLHLGAATLRLGSHEQPAHPYSAYASLARKAVLESNYAPLFFGRGGACQHLIQTTDPPGTVYALVVQPEPVSSGPVLETRIADVALVGPDGVVQLSSSHPSLHLGTKVGTHQAMLVRLDGSATQGRVDYQVVRPQAITSLGCG